jgi:hypothetical protein
VLEELISPTRVINTPLIVEDFIGESVVKEIRAGEYAPTVDTTALVESSGIKNFLVKADEGFHRILSGTLGRVLLTGIENTCNVDMISMTLLYEDIFEGTRNVPNLPLTVKKKLLVKQKFKINQEEWFLRKFMDDWRILQDAFTAYGLNLLIEEGEDPHPYKKYIDELTNNAKVKTIYRKMLWLKTVSSDPLAPIFYSQLASNIPGPGFSGKVFLLPYDLIDKNPLIKSNVEFPPEFSVNKDFLKEYLKVYPKGILIVMFDKPYKKFQRKLMKQYKPTSRFGELITALEKLIKRRRCFETNMITDAVKACERSGLVFCQYKWKVPLPLLYRPVIEMDITSDYLSKKIKSSAIPWRASCLMITKRIGEHTCRTGVRNDLSKKEAETWISHFLRTCLKCQILRGKVTCLKRSLDICEITKKCEECIFYPNVVRAKKITKWWHRC